MPDKKKNHGPAPVAKSTGLSSRDVYARDCDLDENEETFAHILKRIVHTKIARQNANAMRTGR